MVVATQDLAEKRTSDKQLQQFLAMSFNGFLVWGVSHKYAWVPAVHFQLSLNCSASNKVKVYLTTVSLYYHLQCQT